MSDTRLNAGSIPNARRGIETTVLLAALAVASAWCFRKGIVSLFAAWERPEYSHGYLIPVIAIAMAALLGEKQADAALPQKLSPMGLAAIVLGLLMGAFGTLASIPDIVTYGMLISIAGFGVCILGPQRSWKLWPAWIYLFFMLPLPNFIYWPLSIKLQFISSQLGVWFIELLGIPVFLEGNVIDLGTYKLQVAEACSGLRYLFPLASFGFLFAMFFRGQWWKKLILFLSTIPITLGMNSLRIGIIGVLVNAYGREQAEGFLHFFEGWVIFVACMALLYVEAKLLSLIANPAGASGGGLDFDFGRILPNARKWMDFRTNRPLIVVAGLMVLASALWPLLVPPTHAPLDRLRFERFPSEFSGWSGTTTKLDPDTEAVLKADDYLLGDYQSKSEAAPVNFLVSYYESQTNGSGIHSPAVCIPAGGWEVSGWESKALVFDGAAASQFNVNRAVIQNGLNRQLVYYWFEQRGRRLTSDYTTKFYTVLDSATRGRSDGALMRVVTPIVGSDLAGADDRLHRFLEATLPVMGKYVLQ